MFILLGEFLPMLFDLLDYIEKDHCKEFPLNQSLETKDM